MELFLAGLALLLALAAILAAAGIWVTLSTRIQELESRVGGGSATASPMTTSQNGASPEGLPACSPRVRLLAKTFRKEEAIQIYQNENQVSHEEAAAAIEKLMAE